MSLCRESACTCAVGLRLLFCHAAAAYILFAVLAVSQRKGSPEEHPEIVLERCSEQGCRKEHSSVVLDANWRTAYNRSGNEPCIVARGMWDEKLCPDPRTCAENCAVSGFSKRAYANNYGIIAVGGGVRLGYVTRNSWGPSIGSRVYVLDNSEEYKLFQLKNREVAFTVDLSTLPCGVNAAAYFVEMDRSGGRHSRAGAAYGLGYCDARCSHSSNFMDGEANMDWRFGSCCAEMDLWEANRMAMSFTAHPCQINGQNRCHGADCGDTNKGQHYMGLCDKDGCEFNPYRLGDRDFYGMGDILDTSMPITVVTQFLTNNGTDEGYLTEIKRFYIQGGFVIPNSVATVGGMEGSSLTDGFCKKQKEAFEAGARLPNNPQGAFDQFTEKGGLTQMGAALDRGMVLALSVWDDPTTSMAWLDGVSPDGVDPETLGARRGPCGKRDGDSEWSRHMNGDGYAEFTNIRYGAIGSTAVQVETMVAFEDDNKSQRIFPAQRGWACLGAGLFCASCAFVSMVVASIRNRSQTTRLVHYSRTPQTPTRTESPVEVPARRMRRCVDGDQPTDADGDEKDVALMPASQ